MMELRRGNLEKLKKRSVRDGAVEKKVNRWRHRRPEERGTGGGGHTQPPPAKCRQPNGKNPPCFRVDGCFGTAKYRAFRCTYRNNRRTGTRWTAGRKLRNANFERLRQRTSTACVLQVLRLDRFRRSRRCRTPLRMWWRSRDDDAVTRADPPSRAVALTALIVSQSRTEWPKPDGWREFMVCSVAIDPIPYLNYYLRLSFENPTRTISFVQCNRLIFKIYLKFQYVLSLIHLGHIVYLMLN